MKYTVPGIPGEELVKLERAFKRPLAELSRQFPSLTFVYVEAECWGGTCEFSGEIFRDGECLAKESGKGALRRLMVHLDAQLDSNESFEPFSRDFPWRAG